MKCAPPMAGDMNERMFPLSFPQRMFWFLDQIEPDTPAYNVPRALKILGRLDTWALRQAFRSVVHRHDILRTFFVARDGELFQSVLGDVETDFKEHDLSSLPADQRESETLRIA